MKKSTKIIIAILVILVIAAIVFAVLYFATDLFKSKNPKKAFHEELNKLTASESEFSYSDMIASLRNAQNNPFEAKGKVTMDLEIAGIEEEAQKILDVLKKAEISYEMKADPKNSNVYAVLGVNYDGEELATAEIIADEEQVGGKIKDFNDKYMTISMEQIMKALKIDEKALESMNSVDVNEVLDILDISDAEIKRIVDRYSKVIDEALPEENYSSEKEKITVNGSEIEATRYTISLTEKDFMNLVSKVLESLKDDNDTLKLVADKANKIMNIVADNTGESMGEISSSDLKALIESLASSLVSSSGNSSEKLEISLYKNKDQIVRFQVGMSDNQIMVDSTKDGDKETMAFKVKADGKEMTIMTIEQTKKGDNAYTTKMYMDLEGVKLEITLDTEATDAKAVENATIYLEVKDAIKATITMNTELEYKSVSIDELSLENSVNYEDIAQEELAKGLVNFIEKHEDVIKAIAEDLGLAEDEIEKMLEQMSSAIPTAEEAA